MLISSFSMAGNLDSNKQRALKRTQDLLKSPTHRDNYIKDNEGAQYVDAELTRITGGNNSQKEDTYKLGSSIFETIVKKTKGDPAAMKKMIFQLQQKPESIKEILTPAQRQQLRQIANEIELGSTKKN